MKCNKKLKHSKTHSNSDDDDDFSHIFPPQLRQQKQQQKKTDTKKIATNVAQIWRRLTKPETSYLTWQTPSLFLKSLVLYLHRMYDLLLDYKREIQCVDISEIFDNQTSWD